jgi:poly(3-hydroxybutyrate) depolymerase
LAGAALAFALTASAQAAEKLGSYPVDPTQVSVASISSGAFMANQLHIAHSADIMGAAMIAGGLYGCAVEAVEDDGVRALASQAVFDCMRLPTTSKKPRTMPIRRSNSPPRVGSRLCRAGSC